MSTTSSLPPSERYEHDEDELDLRQFVRTLLKNKATIFGCAIFGAALGVGASMLNSKYVTSVLLQMPNNTVAENFSTVVDNFNISVADYKRFAPILNSGSNLLEYLKKTNSINTLEGQELLLLTRSDEALGKVLKPEFTYTDKDKKLWGITLREGKESDSLIGILVETKSKVPTLGKPAYLLADYVRDTMIRADMEARLPSRCADYQQVALKLENDRLANEFEIAQEEKRLANLRTIITQTASTGHVQDVRQIVSVEKGTERYLAPTTQLTASEIQIADMRLNEVRRERNLTAAKLKQAYYCAAQQSLTPNIVGVDFLKSLGEIQNTVFKDQDRSQSIVEQTWNELYLERTQWQNSYFNVIRFLTAPESTEILQRKPSLTLGLVLGLLVGGFFGVLIAFARAWWKENRDALN